MNYWKLGLSVREEKATMNRDMTKPLGWMQRLALTSLKLIEDEEGASFVVAITDKALDLLDTTAFGRKHKNKESIHWALIGRDKGWPVSNSWFYTDIHDTLSIMKGKGWLYKNEYGEYRISPKFRDKVEQVKNQVLNEI